MQILIWTTITISLVHTITGPDHYLPFIALSRSRGWSARKTILWTVVCGCGHVWSSVLLGMSAAAIGWSLSSVEWLQGIRGGMAAWCLFGFGIIYVIWGIIRMRQNRLHKHFDISTNGDVYVYEHREGEIVAPRERRSVTPWVLFVIFILGPCEPLIALLYFPAAQASWFGMVVLIGVYTFITLVTMLVIVMTGYYGIRLLRTGNPVEKYMHVLGGLVVMICGAGMLWMDW